MMSAGASIDWESIARGMTDFTTQFSMPAELITSIPDQAYRGRVGLQSIELPNNITAIGAGAFRGCTGLTQIEIPNSVTSIGNEAFSNCSGLTTINIPNSVTSIGSFAFSSCIGLNIPIVIPNGVTVITAACFYRCIILPSIDMPASVTRIDGQALQGCNSLLRIICRPTTPPPIQTSSLNSTNNCPIYVPDASVNTYKSTSRWSDLASRIFPISDLNV